MNEKILSQLEARLRSGPRTLDELMATARGAGSAWTQSQLSLLLKCLPEVTEANQQYRWEGDDDIDPVLGALLELASDKPVSARRLVRQLPKGLVASAGGLVKLAREHPDLEVKPPDRIKRR